MSRPQNAGYDDSLAGCLRVTGGNLNPEKCNWTPIGFYWDDEGQWHYHTNINSLVLIPNATGAMQVIDRLSPSQATTVVRVGYRLPTVI
jgi:hypothetical protein